MQSTDLAEQKEAKKEIIELNDSTVSTCLVEKPEASMFAHNETCTGR